MHNENYVNQDVVKKELLYKKIMVTWNKKCNKLHSHKYVKNDLKRYYQMKISLCCLSTHFVPYSL
jgi:hypothetical protein